MTDTKFTPGPWDFEPSGKEAGYIGFPDGSGFYAAIRERDGHLIAAAPELYEALEAAANSAGFQYMWPATRSKVEAALAKARGEA